MAGSAPSTQRIHLFVVGASGTVFGHHNGGDASAPWFPLPGPAPFTSGVSAAYYQGALFLFGCIGDKLFMNVMTGGGQWGGWALLADGATGVGTKLTPSAVVHDGVLWLFIVGKDSKVHFKTLAGLWSDWQLQGSASTDTSVHAVDSAGKLALFLRGTDDSIFTSTKTVGLGAFSAWTGVSGGVSPDAPSAAVDAGFVRAVIRSKTNQILYASRTHDHPAFTGWTELAPASSMYYHPAAVSYQTDAVVFYCSTDRDLRCVAITGDTLQGTPKAFGTIPTLEKLAGGPAAVVF